MRLQELEKYRQITIQLHDSPDADALASGYGLYCYFIDKGVQVSLVYSGYNEIKKANLSMMVSRLNLPVTYLNPIREENRRVEGLLITVDCQYGAGNVTRIEADEIAIIDHHQRENHEITLRRIQTNLGSCATLVWLMLKEEGYPVRENPALCTALYYGLYMDTKQFSEIYNPLDMDMREDVPYNKYLITQLRNSNLSLQELEIAGIAMIRYSYNDDHRFAVIRSQPCDPNILGLISDLLIQVDKIDSCVVFNEINDGYKLSVRSCIREVSASELASYLTEGIGSGGGHPEKAGGFISMKLYEERYPTMHSEAYFNSRMMEYFDCFEVIEAKNYEADITGLKLFKQKRIPQAYLRADKLFSPGTPVAVRTSGGDKEFIIEKDMYFVMDRQGDMRSCGREQFESCFEEISEKYSLDEIDFPEYVPTLKNCSTNQLYLFTRYAGICIPARESLFYARKLDHGVKIFTVWDEEHYMAGKRGDYFTIRYGEEKDIRIVIAEDFAQGYVPADETD